MNDSQWVRIKEVRIRPDGTPNIIPHVIDTDLPWNIKYKGHSGEQMMQKEFEAMFDEDKYRIFLSLTLNK